MRKYTEQNHNMAFIDKLFRWKKKPFGDSKKVEPAQISVAQKLQSGKLKKEGDPHGSGCLAHIIIRPHVSEKASELQKLNRYVFEVDSAANKHDIALAIRDLYGIKPLSITIVNKKSRQIRFGRSAGATKAWKKAMVTLPAGKTIDVYKK